MVVGKFKNLSYIWYIPTNEGMGILNLKFKNKTR